MDFSPSAHVSPRHNPQEKAVVSEYRRNIVDPDEGWTGDERGEDDEAKDDFISAP